MGCLAQSIHAFPDTAMSGRRYCLRFTAVPTSKYHFGFVVPFAARSRSIANHGSVSDARQNQLEDILSNRKDLLDDSSEKRGPRVLVRNLNNQYKPSWDESRQGILDGQLQNDLGGGQALSPAGSSKPGFEIHRLCEEGQLDRAVKVLLQMEQAGTVYVYRFLLKACTKRKAVALARQVYAHLARHGLEFTRFLGEYVVSTFVKCGSLEDALQVFSRLPHRSVLSWTAVISGYSMSGQGREALKMYQRMQAQGVQPNTYTFVSLLKACSSIADLEEGKRIHAQALQCRFETDLYVGNCLIGMYGKCGSIEDAQYVFDGLLERDVVSWTAILAAYAQQGQAEKALQLYGQMWEDGVSPNNRTFVSVLQACGMLAEREPVVGDGRSTKVKSLEIGKVLHADAQSKGYDSDVFVGNTLVSMYGKCGCIVEAQIVFDALSHRDEVSWNALLAAYSQQGQAEKALELYEKMWVEGAQLTERTFVSALQACGRLAENIATDGRSSRVKYLELGKSIHADACTKGYDLHVFVCNSLISMYGKCGSIMDARNIFNGLSERDIVSWNAMLGAFVEQGQGEEALQLYGHMQQDGMSPDVRSFVTLLQACVMLTEKESEVLVDGQSIKAVLVWKGKELHADAQRKGYASDVFVGSTLLTMYGKFGSILDACNVFDGLSKKSVVSWNAMLAAYAEHKQAEKALQLYCQMKQESVSADVRTFVSSLQACSMLAEKEEGILIDGQIIKVQSLEHGKAIHTDAQSKGTDADVFVGSTLISMYGKCGSITHAKTVFEGLSVRNVVSWTVMLAAYVEQGQAQNALQVYEQMQEDGISPNEWTFVSALQACGMIADKQADNVVDVQWTNVNLLEKGKGIHADIQRKGYESHAFIGSSIVSMYGKCGSVVDAQNVFDRLSQRDVVSWTVMITAYAEHGQADKALQLYDQMQEEGVSPDARTFVSALQACSMLAEAEVGVIVDGRSTKLKSLKQGRAIHADAQRKGCDSNVFAGSTLVSMYGKCGSVADAQSVFDGLSHRDVVSWNAMLAAYAQQGQAEKALHLYDQMQQEGASPNERTFVSALQACGILAETEKNEVDMMVDRPSIKANALEKGKAIHTDARNKGYDADIFVGNSLISMYGRCGSIIDAQNVFVEFSRRNVVSWNAMLGAYIEHGQGEKALRLYKQMEEQGVSPDEITLVCILQACGNTGSLDICRHIHQTLVSSGKALSLVLANTLIHSYGRCSSMEYAKTVFDAVAQPNVVSWNALIAGYAREGNSAASMQMYEEMLLVGMKPNGVTFLSLLSACSHAGLLDKGVEYFESMSRDYGITPEIEHYVSMVDLLGRAGCFSRVEDLLLTMPMQPDLAMWLCLLGACRKHGKVSLGVQAFDQAVRLEPKLVAAYVLMSNIYADAGLLGRAKKVRLEGGVWKKPGQSWIEHEQGVHTFLAEDCRHAQCEQLYDLLRKSSFKLKKGGCTSHAYQMLSGLGKNAEVPAMTMWEAGSSIWVK